MATDSELPAERLKAIVAEFRALAPGFPADPRQQLRLATEAVFKSWNGKRAIDYRNAAGIAHDLGTAVNIQTMVFGNMGDDSATGVAMSRNATTGEAKIEGDYLINAQGEDVVAGIRATKPLEQLADDLPEMYDQFAAIAARLERHYREMQDMEFTVERGKLWILQTRAGKRTAQAAVRIAADLADEGLISREEAVMRVKPDQVDFFLHPQFSAESLQGAVKLAKGLNVSPGAAVGIAAFDADLAERWAKVDGKPTIMVRPETKPDDVHGMLAAEGILTSRGGRTSHAALVARQFGKPAVVGVAELDIDMAARTMTVAGRTITEGDWISIDGTSGAVYLGRLETVVPDISDPWLMKLLSLGRRAAHPAGAGQRRLPGGRRAGPPLRGGGHRPHPHRAHVLRDRAPAAGPEDDHDHLARGAGRGPGRAAALPAGRLRGPVPGHGRPAGDHPAHRPAAARVPAVGRGPDQAAHRPQGRGGQGRRRGRPRSPRSRGCSPGWRRSTRPTRCWAPAACGWGS